MYRIAQLLAAGWGLLWAWLQGSYTMKRHVVDACTGLGGVYIKFLQMLALHHSTKGLVAEVSNRIAFEEVAYEPIDVVETIGAQKVANYFTSLQVEPFAAGSYGQVYKGELRDGTSVIVKVLRPSVQKYLGIDLFVLGMIARVVGVFARRSFIDSTAVFKEFARATRLETDYELEAQTGEYLREYYANHGSLVVPKTYIELGTQTVLVQEYVEGVSLATAMDLQLEGQAIDRTVFDATGSNVWEQLHTLGKDLLGATLSAEFIMADPHPGNVRLLSNNRVALIDFGLAAKAPNNRGAFAGLIHHFLKLYRGDFDPGSFALAMLSFYDTELSQALRRIAEEYRYDYRTALGALIKTRVTALGDDDKLQYYLKDKQVTKLFTEILTEDNMLGIKIDKSNALLQRSMAAYLSIVRAIGERHDGTVHFKIVEAALADVEAFCETHAIEQSRTPRMTSETAYEVLINWLAVVAERDKSFYSQLTQGGLLV